MKPRCASPRALRSPARRRLARRASPPAAQPGAGHSASRLNHAKDVMRLRFPPVLPALARASATARDASGRRPAVESASRRGGPHVRRVTTSKHFRILCLAFAVAAATVLSLGAGRAVAAAGFHSLTGNKAMSAADTTAPTQAPATFSRGVGDSYKLGDRLFFTAGFDEGVLVTGTPQILVHLDSGDVYADRSFPFPAPGQSTTSLQFFYRIQPDDTTDGFSFEPEVVLPAGVTLEDAAGNDASLAAGAPVTVAGVTIDSFLPNIDSF